MQLLVLHPCRRKGLEAGAFKKIRKLRIVAAEPFRMQLCQASNATEVIRGTLPESVKCSCLALPHRGKMIRNQGDAAHDVP